MSSVGGTVFVARRWWCWWDRGQCGGAMSRDDVQDCVCIVVFPFPFLRRNQCTVSWSRSFDAFFHPHDVRVRLFVQPFPRLTIGG